MSLRVAINSHLSTYAGLVALVGDRLYPLVLPQGVVYPAATYQRISAVREQVFTRAVRGTLVRYQLTGWGKNYDDADDVRAQLRAAALSFAGDGTVSVHDCSLETDIDLYDEQTRTYQHMVDVLWLVRGDL